MNRSAVASIALTVTAAMICALAGGVSWADGPGERLEAVKQDPIALRQFLQRMPKGGDLHTHLSGAVYAESYLAWGAEDGKCINTETFAITLPPCDIRRQSTLLSDYLIRMTPNGGLESLIDALSVRNYQRREISGHDQFFATFERFTPATLGRQGDMVAEVSSRAARQNILYLELMQSLGMFEVAALAETTGRIDAPYGDRIDHDAVDAVVEDVIKTMDQMDARRSELQACDVSGLQRQAGCDVVVRYLSQVIRTLSPIQVYAQTLLAFKLIAADERVVGLNFVAPEDHLVALRDYRQHMNFIAEIGGYFPEQRRGIALHAGELSLGLVPTEHLGWHIREAISVAEAKRIGHGIDISYDEDMTQLLKRMAAQGIMVEINLTSNDVILQVEGAEHPLPTYLSYGVPVALSTDDEGVSRIDLTHEYQRAATTFDLSYEVLRGFSRNSLQYSFLPGEGLFDDAYAGVPMSACLADVLGAEEVSRLCAKALKGSVKASLQWDLERRLRAFEDEF